MSGWKPADLSGVPFPALSFFAAACNNNAVAGAGKLALAFPLIVLLSACAVNKPSEILTPDASLVTGTVNEEIEAEGFDISDARRISEVVGEASANGNGDHLLAWNNPDTGNSGTVSAINEISGNEGTACREFSTTVDSYSGVSLYKGETCKTRKGSWVLSWFKRVAD